MYTLVTERYKRNYNGSTKGRTKKIARTPTRTKGVVVHVYKSLLTSNVQVRIFPATRPSNVQLQLYDFIANY